jgi:hypothetical protein
MDYTDTQDHINAINTVLNMGFKGRAARNEYIYLLNKIIETKRIEEYKNIQRSRLLQSYNKNLRYARCQAILQKPLYALRLDEVESPPSSPNATVLRTSAFESYS